MSDKVLLKGGCVLTLGSKPGNLPTGDVLIEGSVIAEVGVGLRARGAEQVDATDTIIMPGFVDTHRHTWKSLFRNLGGESPLAPDVLAPHYQPDDVYAATLIGLLGAVEAGITTVVDWCDFPLDDGYREASLQAHAEAGLRTVLVHSAPIWGGQEAQPGLHRLVAAGDVTTGPLITVAAGFASPAHTDPSRIGGDWALARELGLRVHTHTGQDETERGSIARLGQILGEDVTLVHCSHLDDPDLDVIASSGAGVSLSPSSEMAGGLGSPPIQKLIDRGIRPGLGIGDEQFAPGDMFAQMRSTISVQHATMFDLKLAGKAGLPSLLTTRQVIRYATSDGAKAIGLHAVTGSVQPGMQADLIVLRTDRPNIAPVNDPVGAVVWGMDTSNLDWVFAAGKALMRNGELQANADRARKQALAAQNRVASASGLVNAAAEPGERG